jgi:DNA polymerase-3 subunit epsilon
VDSNFLAIDFETASHPADSACAIGLVRVEGGKIREQKHFLIRPPRKDFHFTWVHGIKWEHVARERAFDEVWEEAKPMFEGIDFLAAHNAPFDRRVLNACCERYKLEAPATRFLCTVQLARKAWNIRPTRLPNVCSHLGIELKHHEALSDALACARIVIAAHADGVAGTA